GFTCNPNWRCVPYTFSLRAQNPGPLLIETMDGGAGAAAPADSGALLAVGWADEAPATDAGATDGSILDAGAPSAPPPMPPHDGKRGDEEGGDHHKSEEPSGEK
ncbi:MAG TPA: hypothetical protein VHM19_01020, partial [Polyangiales bacterium]|nr:hypothetical protein [Polyangiales bacterium]